MTDYFTLSNGLKVYGEYLPNMRSATIGIWTKTGSAAETMEENGMSHFLEHMFFKGTERRSYQQIAQEIDNMGAQANAFTSKELTCYYIQSIDEKVPQALDILLDMFCHSVFPEKEIQKEKGVILEEIAMSQDSPDDLLHDKLAETFFTGTPLSKTILGPAENIRRFTREDVLAYQKKHYHADNIVVAIAGNYQRQAIQAQLEEQLGSIPGGMPQQIFGPLAGWEPQARELTLKKDIEQVNLGLGFPMYGFLDDRKYAGSILSSILGGGMSSRLFQKVREELGAAYSVYSFPAIYCSGGMMVIYAGTSLEKLEQVTSGIMGEIENLRKNGITEEELKNTKVQLCSSYVMGRETSSAKMNSLGKMALLCGRIIEEDELLEQVRRISMAEIKQAISYIFDLNKMSKVIVQPQKA
ncbi:pitrilysin family protein [Christensenellaceae bacterium 44-20]